MPWTVTKRACPVSHGVGAVETLAVDLSDLDAVDALPGTIDVLVNNAGIQHVSPIHEFPVETWDLIIRLMLTSPFRLTRRVLPHMYDPGLGPGRQRVERPRAAGQRLTRPPMSRPSTGWRACPR